MNGESAAIRFGSRYGGGGASADVFHLIRRLNRPRSRRRFVSASAPRDSAGAGKRTVRLVPEEEKREIGFGRRWVDSVNAAADFSMRRDISLMSHNILGEHNASKHRHLYPNIPHNYLKWDRRKELIFQDVCRWKANIICFQEVDRYHDVLDYMRKDGYAGTFKRRTGGCVDGCALFWREDEFNLLEEEIIEFKSFHLRDNIAQLCIFEVRILLQKAHALAEKWGGIPIVLAGDFNSTPQSAVYEFLSTSELDLSSLDRKYLSGQKKRDPLSLIWPQCYDPSWTNEELKMATGQWACTQLMHPLKLQSAYASIKGGSSARGPEGEPLATTFHSKFLGTVDYIWYSAGILPSRVLDTPMLSSLRKIDGLPSQDIGSDHLALACEFVFQDDHSTQVKPQPYP